jgi:hypothetical protein
VEEAKQLEVGQSLQLIGRVNDRREIENVTVVDIEGENLIVTCTT